MKTRILILSLCVLCFSCTNKNADTFSITGYVDGLEDSTEVSLSYIIYKDNKWKDITDTTHVVNGEFNFNGVIEELTHASISFNNIDGILIFIEPTKIKVSIDMDNLQNSKISGLSVDNEYAELQNTLLNNLMIRDKVANSIQELFYKMDASNGNQELIDSFMHNVILLKSEFQKNESTIDSLNLYFISRNNTYQIAPYILYELARGSSLSNTQLQNIYNQLPDKSKTSMLGKQAHAKIEEHYLMMNEGTISIGEVAPDFGNTDWKGEAINFSDFRDKNYILIDFWASWCAPCIKSIPDIKDIHNQFKDDGLVVIGISLDSKTEEWKNAIIENKIESFIHILGRKDPDNAFLTNPNDIDYTYGIKAIPQYYLIDKEGIVIGEWNKMDDDAIDFIKKQFIK